MLSIQGGLPHNLHDTPWLGIPGVLPAISTTPQLSIQGFGPTTSATPRLSLYLIMASFYFIHLPHFFFSYVGVNTWPSRFATDLWERNDTFIHSQTTGTGQRFSQRELYTENITSVSARTTFIICICDRNQSVSTLSVVLSFILMRYRSLFPLIPVFFFHLIYVNMYANMPC